MLLLYSTLHHTLVLASHLMNCFTDESPTYRVFCRRIHQKSNIHDNYVEALQARLQSSNEISRSNLQVKKEKSKEYYDRTVNVPLFVVGDKVLLHDENSQR
jgi:hypothetical protein